MDPDNQFLYDVDGFNGSFNIMFEYNQTFDNDDLGKCLFGPAAICASTCDCDDAVAIKIVGTKAASCAGGAAPNLTSDLVADNFFLPKDFSSTVTIKPSIQNFNVHLQAYFGFDEWCTGLYARIYAPITVSRWKLETKETITCPGTATNGGYVAGEIAPVAIPTSELFTSFLQYTQGNLIPGAPNTPGQLLGSTVPNVLAGPTVAPLKYTRFGNCNHDTTTQLADLRGELGWNFLLDEDYHLGLYIAAAAPTANDCSEDCNTLLWGAKAGNGKHWELGGGLTFGYTLWRSEDCEQQFDFFVDATINHMFKHNELRTFDLKDAAGNNKPLSRYIMAEQLGAATNTLTVAGTAAKFQFAGAYAPVANFSTQNVSVSFPIQADVMAKFVYTCRGFSWAIGYDFWGQTCPSVEFNSCDNSCNAVTFPTNTWALRGDAHVYGFNLSDGAIASIQPIPATFNATTTFNIGTAFEGSPVTNNNAGVDNAGTPVTVATPAAGTLIVSNSTVSPVNISASNPPVFIQQTDLDICNITKGLSNSVFTELNYTWIDRECWVPYLGIGARVEFGSNGGNSNCNSNCNVNNNVVNNTGCNNSCNNSCNNNCDGCGTCTATVWGIWIRGGLSFN